VVHSRPNLGNRDEREPTADIGDLERYSPPKDIRRKVTLSLEEAAAGCARLV